MSFLNIYTNNHIKRIISLSTQHYDYVLNFRQYDSVSTKTLSRKKTPTQWMTTEIMKVKTIRHNLERTWHRSRTHVDRSCYRQQCHLCNGMMANAKSKYSADASSENSDNPRRLWNSINKILQKIHAGSAIIRMSKIILWPKYRIFHRCKKQKLDPKWTFLNVWQKMKLSKSCDLDLIPTRVLKNSLDIIITPVSLT